MTEPGLTVDVSDIRDRHRIEDVVERSGVQLRRVGRSLMGQCPFHDDDTASLSVGGVPDRFHCFGCGASGDVIDYVGRLHRLSFREAVDHLEHNPPSPPIAIPLRAADRPYAASPVTVSVDRAHAIHQLAWEHYARPVSHEFALAYLRHHRGIDLRPAERLCGQPLVGHSGTGWTSQTTHLRRHDVTDDELLALDLAQPTRRGTLIDSLRGRLVVPITRPDGRIDGFIGRDTTGDPRAPKYRNPTRTPTFDKSNMLYTPTGRVPRHATLVVVVEGTLDALAITAAAAATGRPVAAVAAGGVTVTRAQADLALALTDQPLLIALDGDPAGRDGITRWVALVCRDLHRPVNVATLPDGRDPADWLAEHGPAGLRLLDDTRPPARELVHLAIDSGRHPMTELLRTLTPVAAALPGPSGRALLTAAVREATRRGWNPAHQLETALAPHLTPSPASPAAALTPQL